MQTLTADPKLYSKACHSCEEERAALFGSVAAQLRAMHPNARQQLPRLTEMASKLAMSRSTLVRRLADEGLTYQDILDEARRELA